MKTGIITIAFGLLFSFRVFTQSENVNQTSFTTAIEDNSMFIEEAYNQEDRVVQHISNLVFLPNLKDDFFYAFTQEWPAFGLKHQLSYTLLYNSFSKDDVQGFGDVMVNYRYQLSYKENYLTCSPRLSLIIPVGNKELGLGEGSWGMQVNLPISKRWTNHFINHFNMGTTYLFRVKKEELDFDKPLYGFFAGFSSIWLVSEKFNLMLEYISNINGNAEMKNTVNYTTHTIIAPAFRFAIDLKKLQIVPGLSIPISLQKDVNPEVGAFFYLSFEHGY